MSRKYVVKTRIEAVMLIAMGLGSEFFWTGESTPKKTPNFGRVFSLDSFTKSG